MALLYQEKKPYMDKVAELKAEYEKALESYKAGDVWFLFIGW